jgi:hypothetical protein
MPRLAHTFLRYWSFNMTIAWAIQMSTPGFSYSEPEKARMRELASSISGRSALIWLGTTVVLYILIAVGAVVGGMVPITTHAWPDPSMMPAAPFFALLLAVMALTLGFGLPISITIAGTLAEWAGGGVDSAALPIDALIRTKVRWQLWRLIALLCGFGVPAAMLFATFNINLNSLVLRLRIVSFGLFAVTSLAAWRARILAVRNKH